MNNWNIKINEVGPSTFSGSIENNGEKIASIPTTNSFDKALTQGRAIVLNRIKFFDKRFAAIKVAQAMFYNKYIKSNLYNGIHGVMVKKDDKGNPYLEVSMDTSNDKLVRQVPDSITEPKSRLDFTIAKVGRSIPTEHLAKA